MKPSVYTVAPCCPASAESTVVVCLVTNFSPKDLTIKWVPEVTPKDLALAPVEKEKNIYVTSSRFVVTAGGQAPQCHVAHPPSGVTVTKSFPQDVCKPATQPPRVYLVEPRCGDEAGEMQLLCLLWSSEVDRPKMSWLLNGKEVPQLSTEVAGGGRSWLEISRQSWDKGDVYTCKVTLSPGKEVVMRNTSKCTACAGASLPPQLLAAQPSYADLLAGPARASCLLLGRPLEGATLSWLDGRGPRAAQPRRHPNGTQSLLLTRPLSLAQWAAGGELGCRATLPCHAPLARELRLGPAPGPRKPPNVTVTRLPPGDTRGGLLLCDVSGFSPRDINIRWAGAQDLQTRTETGPVTGQDVFSILSVLRLEEGEEGKDYACVVHHPTLQEPLQVTADVASPTLSPTPETQEDSSSHHVCPRSPPSSLRPPSFHDLFQRRAANLTCTTLLANATVSWAVGGQAADPEAVRTSSDGATETRSWLRVSLRDWNSTANFSCRVRGGAEETRLEIGRKMGPLKPPSIHVLPSSLAEACAGRDFTLFCLVEDFYPPEIAAWWRRGASDGPAQEAASCDHEARRCSLVITAAVPWDEWVGGTSYSCLAAHISSGQLAEKTVDTHADPWDCARLHFVPCGLLGEGDDLEPEEDGSAWTTISTFVVLFLLLIFYSGFVTFIKVK